MGRKIGLGSRREGKEGGQKKRRVGRRGKEAGGSGENEERIGRNACKEEMGNAG